MFTTIGLIIVAIITGGSLLALFGFFGPLSKDVFAVLPFVIYVGCISFILLIAANILKMILSVPQRRRQGNQVKRVQDGETKLLSENMHESGNRTRSKQQEYSRRKRK
jgi:DMSO reductase anchor subunit